jgi:hypothetical protein
MADRDQNTEGEGTIRRSAGDDHEAGSRGSMQMG